MYPAVTSPVQPKNCSRKKVKAPCVLDRSKALVITEKSCYIACINTCYANPSLDPSHPDLSRLDCIVAGRQLPCSLCLSCLGGSSPVFPPSPLPAGSAPLPSLKEPQIIRKLATPKKNKLKKKEREVAEKHLLSFGETIRQTELRSTTHKYRPQSSYFPSRVLSLLLDTLLIIQFPSDLEQILNSSWSYYSSYGTALFDSIIQIQTSINVQRTSTRELTRVKQLAKRQAIKAIEDENSSNAEPTENFVEEPTEEPLDTSEISLGCKRQALEEVTNTTKRRRAPRAPQPTVAQVQESYGPHYRTRQSVRVAESSGGNGGKEN